MGEIPRGINPDAMKVSRRQIAKTVATSTREAVKGLQPSDFVLKEDHSSPIQPIQKEQTVQNLVTLSMFDQNLCDTLFAQYYVQQKDITWLARIGDPERFSISEKSRRTTYLKKNRRVSKDEYDEKRIEEIDRQTRTSKRQINDTIYKNIMDEFNLKSTDEAESFFQKQWDTGVKATEKHISVVYGEDGYFLHDEMKMEGQTPADLIQLLVSKTTDHELREQIKTNLLLSRIAAELETSAQGAGKKLAQLQTLFNKKLYVGKTGHTETITKYGVYTDTNELVGDPVDKKPEEESIPRGIHYKKILTKVRTIPNAKNGDIKVVQIANIKSPETGIEKALRKTLKERTENDLVKTNAFVEDTHRMMFVVMGDKEQAEEVRGKLVDTIGANYDAFGTRVPEDVQISDAAKSEDQGKSKEYKRLRIKLTFKDIEKPIEIIIQTLPEFLRGSYNVGEYDGATDTVSGPNHEILEVVRARGVSRLFLPAMDFNHHPAPTRIQYEDTEQMEQTRVQKIAQDALEKRTIIIG